MYSSFRRARISGSHTFVSLDFKLESNKEESRRLRLLTAIGSMLELSATGSVTWKNPPLSFYVIACVGSMNHRVLRHSKNLFEVNYVVRRWWVWSRSVRYPMSQQRGPTLGRPRPWPASWRASRRSVWFYFTKFTHEFDSENHPPHKIVNSLFTFTNDKNKLTTWWESCLPETK